ncbi:MAG TPA: arginine deiminase family protein [Pseudonocardia sp.]|uniref:dimethylarginine dimethylaminohydrolase family protein n=1 Tax=Pseudonocardia sp. TaxID=60912 RepID=UPI002BD5886A|nr:arginine deiminase family protein [Pseudonocardia sp.]HTF53282.1 arginine deiminase family protein [Pseudonocardia sp.]
MDSAGTQIAAEVSYGVRSMSAPLRRVLLRRPTTTGDFAAADWRTPDPVLLGRQHDEFAALLASLGAQVELADPVDGLVDALYARDPALVTARGAILFQMVKPVRRLEPELLGAEFERAGVPVIGRLTGDAVADGGDFIWLDEHTLVVGRSYRTNEPAVAQLRALLAEEGVTVASVDLPHATGPDHVLHLMSFISPVADDLAVVYPPLAPVSLMQALAVRGVTVVPVDDEEYLSMGCNVLAVRPRVAVLMDGNPRTRAALEAHGCETHVYDGSDVSVKGDGGPTCLTAPLWRA